MCVKENDISGFGTIDSTIFSPELKMYSLFLNHGDTVEYKGEYDFDLIRRATYDIQGISQMQEDNCIYNEQRLNEYNDIRKKLANILVTKKPEKEVEKQFENNSISENEISEDDKIALKGLYYIQMLKSKMKIKIYQEKLNGIKTKQVDFS